MKRPYKRAGLHYIAFSESGDATTELVPPELSKKTAINVSVTNLG